MPAFDFNLIMQNSLELVENWRIQISRLLKLFSQSNCPISKGELMPGFNFFSMGLKILHMHLWYFFIATPAAEEVMPMPYLLLPLLLRYNNK